MYPFGTGPKLPNVSNDYLVPPIKGVEIPEELDSYALPKAA